MAETKDTTPIPAGSFREIRSLSDCVGQKVMLWHPALANFQPKDSTVVHKAKVLQVDPVLGMLLVQVGTPALKGRYLLPIDQAVIKVR